MKKIVLIGILVLVIAAVLYYIVTIKKPAPLIPPPVVKEEVEKVEERVEELAIKDLIFTSNKDGPPRIYTIDLDGKNQIKLSGDPSSIWDGLPAYSFLTAGHRIAFVSDNLVKGRGIYVLDGKEIIKLIDGYDPALSPNGKMIAFSSRSPTGDYEIYVIKDMDKVINEIKSGIKTEINLLNISEHPADDWAPSWLSNERIVFTSERDRNAEVYVVNIDGTGLVNLTNNSAWDGLPSCSRDGIVFQSDRTGNFDIWQMDKEGKNLINSTNHPADDRWPAISPDGTRIAFSSDRESEGNTNIWVIEKGRLARLTNQLLVDDWAPRWTR